MDFKAMVSGAFNQATTAYQWGNQVPINPALFQKNRMDEADSVGIDWPGQDDASADAKVATAAVIAYAIFYQGLLDRVKNEPEPDNPTDDFHAWWTSVKNPQQAP